MNKNEWQKTQAIHMTIQSADFHHIGIKSDKELTDEELIKAFQRHLVYQYTEEGWEDSDTWTEEDHFDVYDENGNANHVDYILKTSDTIPDFEEIDIDDYYDDI